jgi:hypothetical protein
MNIILSIFIGCLVFSSGLNENIYNLSAAVMWISSILHILVLFISSEKLFGDSPTRCYFCNVVWVISAIYLAYLGSTTLGVVMIFITLFGSIKRKLYMEGLENGTNG